MDGGQETIWLFVIYMWTGDGVERVGGWVGWTAMLSREGGCMEITIIKLPIRERGCYPLENEQ